MTANSGMIKSRTEASRSQTRPQESHFINHCYIQESVMVGRDEWSCTSSPASREALYNAYILTNLEMCKEYR